MLQENKTLKQNSTQHRKFYAPLTVSQQVENVPDTPEKEQPSFSETVANAVNVSGIPHAAAKASVSGKPKVDESKQKLTRYRTLGGLEHMFTAFSGHGAEINCLMVTVETVYQIPEEVAHTAFIYLLMRHPLLRMCIQKDPSSESGALQFMEMKPLVYDFQASDRTDWLDYLLEGCRPFQGSSSPLIRFRLINSTPIVSKQLNVPNVQCTVNAESQTQYNYRTVFLYIAHHSIMDGGYNVWSFQEYLNFVDAVATKQVHGKIKEVPMLGPVEDLISSMYTDEDDHLASIPCQNKPSTKYSVHYCGDSTNIKILTDYNEKFAHEIQMLSSRRSGHGCETFQLSKDETKTFIRLCQSMQCSPKSVLTSAAIFSLLDLIYAEEPISNVEIPFEFMLDIRRFPSLISRIGNVPHFPGVATIHAPLIASLDLSNGRATTEFRQFTQTVEAELSKQLIPEKIIKMIRGCKKFLAESNRRLTPGKSPYTLCISNMGKLDGVIAEDVSRRLRIEEIQGYSTIMIDEMPLFLVTTLLLNGHLSGNVSFCNSYTSVETSKRFVALFQKYLTSVQSNM